MASVLVAGSANLDFVVRTARIPAPGETVLGHGFATYPGGKGANQAVACKRAGGAPTRMLLALGDDAWAAPVESSLREAGVELHLERVHGTPTGAAFVAVAAGGENAITVAPGANECLEAADLPPLAGVSRLVLQLETPLPAVAAWAQAARAAGVPVLLNAAPARTLPRELLAAVDVLVVNEGELRTIAGSAADLDDAMRRTGVANVVVTLGARGSIALTAAGRIEQPAFAVDVVDTTAAGDTFCGVLAAALARRSPWPAALREAAAAAALACTRAGAQASIPQRAEVLALLENRSG